jgi:hypothetical protein
VRFASTCEPSTCEPCCCCCWLFALQEWTAKDGAAAQQLVAKLQDIAQQHGHALSNAEAISSTVIAEITTPAKGKQRGRSY